MREGNPAPALYGYGPIVYGSKRGNMGSMGNMAIPVDNLRVFNAMVFHFVKSLLRSDDKLGRDYKLDRFAG
jgi:hypothetical protein